MKHILIIEDERAVAELERDYLEINSFKVSIEETGEGGLQRALKGDIDLPGASPQNRYTNSYCFRKEK